MLLACGLLLCAWAREQAWAQDAPPATTDIRGVVKDENGMPAADETVVAQGPADVTTPTDANGSYDLHVPPGVYRVVVSKSNYETAIENTLTVTSPGAIA